MTEYRFTGAHPRILTGLSQGVNALLTPAQGDTPPDGSTLEARPGDAVSTDEPYEHPELAEIVPELQPTNTDGSPIPASKPPKPSRATTTPDPDTTDN